MSSVPIQRTDAQEAEYRAAWLNQNKAPKNWVVLTIEEVAIIRADLSRVTNDWHRLGKLCEEYEHAQVGLKRDLTRVTADNSSLAERLTAAELERDRLGAELEELQGSHDLNQIASDALNDLRADLARVTAELEQAEQRNAELEAALDDLLGCPTVTDLATCPNGDPSRIDEAPEWQAVLQISCAWTRYKKLKVLASAESATPAKQEAAR